MICQFCDHPRDAVVLIKPRGSKPAAACVDCWARWELFGHKSDLVIPADAGGITRGHWRRNRQPRRPK